MSQKLSKWILAEVPDIPPDVDSSMPKVLVRMLLQRGVEISDMDEYLHTRLKI
jgi:hypothetical protein